MSIKAPEADIAILSIAADTALGNYALNGGFHPFGVVETPAGVVIVPSEGFSTQDEKIEFVNILRCISIEHSGRCSAIAMETWTMESAEDEDNALLEEIYKRGGSMSEHPKAGEAIFVIAESDAGTTTRMHRIVRDGETATLAPGEAQFIGVEDMRSRASGLFSKFHVPTGLQTDPQAMLEAMAKLVGTSLQRVVPGDAKKGN